LVVTTIACSSSREAPATARSASEARATVELDLYSGRPNPTWDLSGADTRTLETMLRSLPTAPPAAPADTLGYRGFVVRFTGSAGSSTTLRVHKGVVQRGTGTSATYLEDSGGRVEAWLLNTGKPTLSSETYQYVQKEVAPNGKQ
jgi:hypothetical protein